MPFYDYVCLDCHQRFEMFLTYAEYGTRPVTCPHCQSQRVRRRFARVRIAKSTESRIESLTSDLSDPSALEGLENDPQAMGRLMRKMGQELGEDLPPEFNEVVDRLEKGQSPEEIEKALPEMGEEGGESEEGRE
jgi:putative FmdB family regulatory protein